VPSAPSNSTPGFDPYADMSKRKDRREAAGLAPPSNDADTAAARPTTPTSPVQIPRKQSSRSLAHPPKRRSGHPRKSRDAHDPDSLSPSVAALLAMTDIPRPRQGQPRRRIANKSLTVDDIIDRHQVSEKEMSWNLSRRGPMDMLLSPPEELLDDDLSISDSNMGSVLSTRTVSVDSIPSLGDSFPTELASSLDTPGSASPSGRRRRSSPMRRSLEPVRSPPDTIEEHPLNGRADVDEIDFQPLPPSITPSEHQRPQSAQSLKPLRSVFKSNLTASLRALRSAAKSFSALEFPVSRPDDALTRSMLTIDSKVPYTDERRPPVTEEIPSAEMRRYLNPTTGSRPETTAAPQGAFSASIQMQTYKVHRSRSAPPTLRGSSPALTSAAPQQPQQPPSSEPGPPPRQREMRENSDFIRIAVMEMAMRKLGKLDDQRPGRARWALPPRRTALKPYQIGADGVPARWVSVSY
jgi:hypothetical protein